MVYSYKKPRYCRTYYRAIQNMSASERFENYHPFLAGVLKYGGFAAIVVIMFLVYYFC